MRLLLFDRHGVSWHRPGEVPVGAWYCNNCRKKNDITADVKRYKPVPRSGSAALGAVVDNMNKANSKAFELPRDLEDEAQAKKKEIEEDEDRVDREANAQSEWIGDGHFSRESGGSGPGTVGLVGLRHGTGSMGAGGTQLATILAAQSFQPTDFRGCDGICFACTQHVGSSNDIRVCAKYVPITGNLWGQF